MGEGQAKFRELAGLSKRLVIEERRLPMRSSKILFPLLVVLCLLAGCASAAEEQPLTAKPGEEFQLSPAQSARIDGPGGVLEIEFVGVTSDLRCPSDARCIQAGEAVVALSMALDGNPQTAELSTSGSELGSTWLGRYTIRLRALAPYPVSTAAIKPQDYLATLLVESE